MLLEKSIEAFGTDDFEDVLIEDLSGDRNFDSQEHWSDAGLNDDGEISILDFSDDKTHIFVKVYFSFEEHIPSGCRDIVHTRHRHYRYDVSIDKQTGEYALRRDEETEPEF